MASKSKFCQIEIFIILSKQMQKIIEIDTISTARESRDVTKYWSIELLSSSLAVPDSARIHQVNRIEDESIIPNLVTIMDASQCKSMQTEKGNRKRNAVKQSNKFDKWQ